MPSLLRALATFMRGPSECSTAPSTICEVAEACGFLLYRKPGRHASARILGADAGLLEYTGSGAEADKALARAVALWALKRSKTAFRPQHVDDLATLMLADTSPTSSDADGGNEQRPPSGVYLRKCDKSGATSELRRIG
jgi:hypothetical protein